MARKTDPNADAAPLFCDRCGIELTPGSGNFYQIRIVAFADPTPPTVPDLPPGVIRGEIEDLIARLADVSEREAMDQVHRQVVIFLCVPCYRRWIEDPAGKA